MLKSLTGGRIIIEAADKFIKFLSLSLIISNPTLLNMSTKI